MWSVDWRLVASVALPVGLGFGVGFLTRDETSSPWYQSLKKPSWQPPRQVFPVVWTVLYILMGVAAYRVWAAGGRRDPMVLYGVQLALNILWSLVFFGAKSLQWSVNVIVALLAVLTATTVSFYSVDRTAGYLMLPYLAWVCLATALTLNIHMNNVHAK